MRKRTIITSGVVAALVLGYAGATWYTGQQIYQQFPQYVTRVNQQQQQINVEYSNYQQGFFTSSVQLKITDQGHNNKVVFDKPVTLYHGPFPWSEVKHFALLPKLAGAEFNVDLALQHIQLRDYLQTRMALSYFGNMITYLHAPNIAQEKQNEKIDIKAFDVKMKSDQQRNVNLIGKMPYIYYQLNTKDYRLNDAQFDLNLAQTSKLIEGNFKVNEFTIDANSNNIKLNKAVFNFAPIKNDKQTSNIQNVALTADSLRYGHLSLNELDYKLQYSPETRHQFALQLKNKATYGLQDLGAGLLDFQIKNWSYQTFAQKGLTPTDITLNQLFWQNARGQITISGDLSLNHAQAGLQIDTTNINRFNLHANVPFDPLIYLMGQIDQPKQSEVNVASLDMLKYGLLTASEYYLPPIFIIQKEDSEQRKIGLYSDIEFDQQQPEVKVNGQSYSKAQFLEILSK